MPFKRLDACRGLVGPGMLGCSMTNLSKSILSFLQPLVLLFVLLANTSAFALQQSGPPTPKVDGTSPIWGYLIAVVLMILLLVVSIIPSKRHFEDI